MSEGRLDPEQLDRYVIPVYERTVDEVKRPFGEAIGERLVLEHLDVGESGDVAEDASDFVGFFRAFSQPSLRAALDPSGRALPELYRRLEERVASRGEDFSFVVHPLTLVIRRGQ